VTKISDGDLPDVFAEVARLAAADGMRLVIEDNPDDFDNPLIKLVTAEGQ
jgi:hypothetical protein